jgi:uncharacterized protein YgiM (DUF1202 family)
MNQRWISAVICLTLLMAAAAGCAAETYSTTVDEPAEPPQTPDGNVLDFPAPTITPVSVLSSPSPEGEGPVETAAQAPPDSSESPESSPAATPVPAPAYGMKATNNERGYIKGHDVNLREGPGTQYDAVDTVNYHTTVVITAKYDLWYCI